MLPDPKGSHDDETHRFPGTLSPLWPTQELDAPLQNLRLKILARYIFHVAKHRGAGNGRQYAKEVLPAHRSYGGRSPVPSDAPTKSTSETLLDYRHEAGSDLRRIAASDLGMTH
jgi:hypothetical protein